VKVAWIVAATAVALALQTTVARYVVRGSIAVDLILVVVVYAALAAGPVTGLLTGTFAGLLQDALSRGTGGIIGIGGLAKTIVGFLTGIVGTQFIVSQSLPRFIVFFAATLVHAVIFIGLYLILDSRPFGSVYAVFGQALGNALVGVVAFQLSELLPGAVERRRMQRGRVRRD
jgi:rod shape-determining protein MreD